MNWCAGNPSPTCLRATAAESRMMLFSTAISDKTNRWTAAAGRTLSGAASLRVTAAYAIALVAVWITLTELSAPARDAVVSDMSTNLHNLAHGHLGTLVGSAFVSDGGDLFAWLPGLVCLLA